MLKGKIAFKINYRSIYFSFQLFPIKTKKKKIESKTLSRFAQSFSASISQINKFIKFLISLSIHTFYIICNLRNKFQVDLLKKKHFMAYVSYSIDCRVISPN